MSDVGGLQQAAVAVSGIIHDAFRTGILCETTHLSLSWSLQSVIPSSVPVSPSFTFSHPAKPLRGEACSAHK